MLREILPRGSDKVIQNIYDEENSNLVFCILYFNCRLMMFVTKVNRNGFETTFRKCVEFLVTGDECSVFFYCFLG